ncbi:MAG: hypothetical protein NE334_10240 [Lentisphaeraceae bacterium]|nr:hypothetical protein [Lentisphaeraceae bacterium]
MSKDLQLNPMLVELMCCPACKGNSSLSKDDNGQNLECDQCSRKYFLKEVPGRDGQGLLIPSLLVEED